MQRKQWKNKLLVSPSFQSPMLYPGLGAIALLFLHSSLFPSFVLTANYFCNYKAIAMNGEQSFRSFPHPSSASLAEMVALHNPIQLAAISNYKLAQLTFAPPNGDSLRKTALVKNMLEVLYRDTPEEWLNQMTRWVFFTPE